MEDRKLKLLMTTDTVGGVWVYSLELCKTLQQKNVEIHLAAMGAWPSPEQEEEASQIPNVTLYKSDYKLEWMQDPWEDVEQAGKWINSIYHTIQPDLVHLNNYAQIKKDWQAPTVTVFHSCVQTWWQAVKGTSAPSHWNKYTQVVKESLEASDLVVSPTKAILKRALDTHRFSSETKVIYNGRDFLTSEEKPKEEFIFCIGRIWDEAKNLKLLSQISQKLSWPVFIAGENRDPLSGEKKEFENVTFLGKLPQQEVKEWMQRAAIFASPTKYEPFGLAILEAAKSGCALVLSRLETLEELWGGAAQFFDPEKPEEAEKLINELIETQSLRKEFSEKAKEQSKKYSSAQMGAEYYALYLEMISKTQNKLSV